MLQRCVLVSIAGLASLWTGCLDATPVYIQSQDAGLVVDGETPADSPLPVDAYAHPECRACIAADPSLGPGCGDKLAACGTTAHCLDIYECAYRKGCVTKRSQNESIACALPCAADLKDVNDPSIQFAIRLTECFHSVCAQWCEVSDLAGPPQP